MTHTVELLVPKLYAPIHTYGRGCILTIWLKWTIGLFVSLIIGQWVIYSLIMFFRKRYKFPPKRMETPMLLGSLERFIFTMSFILGQESFIAFWLGVKIISRWSPEGKVPEPNLQSDQKLDAINLFLIGNLLSVVFSYIGAYIIVK